MSTARAIDAHLSRACRSNPNAVRVVVLDGDRALCLNESQLDTWWQNLAPVTKAEIYEQVLGDADERCRYCGCTQQRACPGSCSWLDSNHTVCSAPACAAKYTASLRASLADTTPISELADLQANLHAALVGEMMAAAAQLLPEARSVDAHC